MKLNSRIRYHEKDGTIVDFYNADEAIVLFDDNYITQINIDQLTPINQTNSTTETIEDEANEPTILHPPLPGTIVKNKKHNYKGYVSSILDYSNNFVNLIWNQKFYDEWRVMVNYGNTNDTIAEEPCGNLIILDEPKIDVIEVFFKYNKPIRCEINEKTKQLIDMIVIVRRDTITNKLIWNDEFRKKTEKLIKLANKNY